MHDLFFLWAVATSALCIGLLINQFRNTPLTLEYRSKEVRLQSAVERVAPLPMLSPKQITLPETLSLGEFEAYVEKGSGLVLDARPDIFYRLGHVPGALSLPRDDFESAYKNLQKTLEADRSRAVVIYCSGSSCEDAALVRKALYALGYTQLSIFEGGWAEWTGAGKPKETKQ